MVFHKICLIGSFGVGKTSLVRRFVSGIYDDRYLTTVGVRIDRKEMRVGEVDVTLVVWDLAGEDEMTRLSMTHLRGMSGYFLVTDGMRRDSFQTALRLRKEVEAAHPGAPFVLLINKRDLKSTWVVEGRELELLASEGWRILETSAKTGEGVEEAFQMLASGLIAQ